MITKRDEEILKFINFFGKTYTKVLEKTFFPSFSAAENRVANLKKQDIISFWNTNLVSPRRAIVLSESTKNYFERHLDIKVKKTKIHLSTIEHNIIEQITFFWLQKIGEVKRTVVFITPPINNLNYDIIWHGKNRCKKIITKRVV